LSKFLTSFLANKKNQFTKVASEGVFGEPTAYYDTGVYLLNAQVSGDIFRGVPNSGTILVSGVSSSGKTIIIVESIALFLQTYPDGIVHLFLSENAQTADRLEKRGIDLSRLIISPVPTVEDWRTESVDFLDQLAKTPAKDRPPVMMVLDSLGQLSTRKETDDIATGTDKRDMTRAQLIRGAFRQLDLKCGALNVPYYITNHVYDVPGSVTGQKVQGGGAGAIYAAGTILELSKRQDRDASSKETTGVIITVKATKNRNAKENTKIELLLDYNTGFNRYSGLLPIMLELGIWKSVSKRIELADGRKYFEGRIYDNAEELFTPYLSQINEYVANKFRYGTTGEITSEYAVDEESDSE
jgi:RecA/RadA recombinase